MTDDEHRSLAEIRSIVQSASMLPCYMYAQLHSVDSNIETSSNRPLSHSSACCTNRSLQVLFCQLNHYQVPCFHTLFDICVIPS